LAAFEAEAEALHADGIGIVAGSVDGPEQAEATVRACGLSFPVLHSLPLLPTATTLTTFYETRRSILHATGFVVRPDGTIAVAAYSTGPIGRLDPVDVVRVVRFWKAR
jgi:peroxiredoxin